MDRVTDEAGHQSLDDLALRMTAYRERALAARRLADAITDKRATTGFSRMPKSSKRRPKKSRRRSCCSPIPKTTQ